MKMMNINGKEECYMEDVTPSKKKKMIQAQLPFQTRSLVQSSSIVKNKKRKLTSPSVEHKSPKAIKVLMKNLNKDVSSESSNTVNIKNKDDNCIEVMEETETENIKENTKSNKKDTKSQNDSPKQILSGQKKINKQEKLKSNSLTKFLATTDKQRNNSKEKSQNSLREEKDELVKKSSSGATEISVSQTTSNLNHKIEGSPLVANSPCQSDSDITIISSDNEDRSEQMESNVNTDNSVVESSQVKTPTSSKTKEKKLTPKQKEIKLLRANRKEERKRMKMEKEKKLEEERENRRREKQEKRKEKEQREKAEKEQKIMEKKMKEQKKQMEIEQKQRERQAKDEERKRREEAKEEEKRKKEEEKLEAERKKQKAASNFTSFFVAKKLEKSIEDEDAIKAKNFMPFEIKADMKVAPVCRRTLSEQEKLFLDKKCNEGTTPVSDLYLCEIKNKRIVPRTSSKTWPLEAKDDVVILDEENDGSSNILNQNIVVEKQRPKLLQFSENRRPPYWGTWRKSSQNINPRRPFLKDTKWFNYEVDSDDEWEEEEPGESLHGSDDEKDEENPDDNEYDVDNDFMVPHGYLSDEELRADEEEKKDMSPETQKFKLKVLGEQFESERNAKTSKLKPKIIGCIWRGPDNKFAPSVPQKTVNLLTAHEAWVCRIPITLSITVENEATTANEGSTSTHQPTPTSSKKTRVPAEAVPDLIRLIHGNSHGVQFLVKEFITYWNKVKQNQISKISLTHKIRELAKWKPCPEEGPMHLKVCWYVPEKIRNEYLDEELSLPNRWSYCLTPRRKSELVEVTEKPDRGDKEKKNAPLITQFTKKISQEEMKKQLTEQSASTTPRSKPASTTPRGKPAPATPQSKPAPAKPLKRATLISVGRDEQFPSSTNQRSLKKFGSNVTVKNENLNKTSNDAILVASEDDEPDITEILSDQAIKRESKEVDKSDNEMKNEDRLGVTPMKCKKEPENVEKSFQTVGKDKDRATLKIETDKTDSKNDAPNESVTEMIDISMDVDGDD